MPTTYQADPTSSICGPHIVSGLSELRFCLRQLGGRSGLPGEDTYSCLLGRVRFDILVGAVPEELFHASPLSTSTFLIAFDSGSLLASEDYLLFSVLGTSGPVNPPRGAACLLD